MTDELHGRLRHPGEIEDAAIARLRKWIPYYLEVTGAQHDYGSVERPKQFAVLNDFETFPEQNLPTIIVSAARSAGEFDRAGDGYFTGNFTLDVLAVVAAASSDGVRKLGRIYGTAIAAALLQQPEIGDEITINDWIGIESLPVSTQKARQIYAVENTFAVEMKHMISDLMGPMTENPPDPITTDLPEIDEVDVQVEPKENE